MKYHNSPDFFTIKFYSIILLSNIIIIVKYNFILHYLIFIIFWSFCKNFINFIYLFCLLDYNIL